MIYLFTISVSLVVFSYLMYPVIIYFLTFLKKINVQERKDFQPTISVIISFFNEEDIIESTLNNFLNLDYDYNKIEFVLGSDNSTDRTNEILTGFQKKHPNFKIFLFEKRRGKSHVLNDLVKAAKGDVLVFSDANTIYEKDAIKQLVKFYVDPKIGGVSGKLVLTHNKYDITNHEANYWNFETWIKCNEGKLGILIGANGGIYSIKRDLYTNIPSEYPVMDDFFISLKVLEKGKYFLYENKAIAIEEAAPDTRIEFKRKIRNNAIDLSTIKAIKTLLKPNKGLIAFALWSHKLIRWFTPIFLILIFISNYFLIDNVFFNLIFKLQIIFYLSAILGYILSVFKIKLLPFSLVYYFTIINIGLLIGIIKFFTGKQTAFWQSTKREK